MNFHFHLLLESESDRETVQQLLAQVPIDCSIYRQAEELVALCPAIPSALIFEYEVNGITANDYIYELALQAGWSEIPWVLVAPEARLAQAKSLQATLPQIVEVVGTATPPVQWEKILEKLINHFPPFASEAETPAVTTGHSLQALPASTPSVTPAVPPAMPLDSYKLKLSKHPAVEHFFVWDVVEDRVETSSPAALQFKEESQFALTMMTKMSEELSLGDLLEFHILAPDRFGSVFSVELSWPERKAHAVGLVSKLGFEARSVVASLRN